MTHIRIKMENPFEIKVWAQMFFDDGSVSQGIRVSVDIYDNDIILERIKDNLLKSVNRKNGFLVVWGAGNIMYKSYFTSSSEEESDSSASSPEST